MKNRNDMRRPGPSRAPKPLFLIACEGSRTERDYFEDLNKKHGRPVVLDFVKTGADPKTLVEHAAKARKMRRDEFPEVWVIYDCDDHKRLLDAGQQARDNKLRVAFSNPCFELWALLHFQDQTAHIDRHKLRAVCQTHMPGYDKMLPCDTLIPLTDSAEERAVALRKRHDRNQTAGENPSTDVDQLVRRILSAAGSTSPLDTPVIARC